MKKFKRIVAVLLLGAWLPIYAQVEHTYQDKDDKVDTVASITETDTIDADSIDMPWEQCVPERLNKLLRHSMFKTSQVGLMVYDITADSVLYQHNEQQLMRPASTLKTLTAIAALDKLGGDYQLKTELYYTGKIENGTLTGNVYCVGGMDPMFNKSDMNAFVDCIKSLGIDTIRGNLYADKSMKDLNTLGNGWCWDDDNPVLSPLVYQRKDHFMEEFERQLRFRGITVEAYSALGKCPYSAILMCQRTHNIDQVLHTMLKRSDNLYAESLFYQLAAHGAGRTITSKDAGRVVAQLIQKLGLDAFRYRIADGSGLSLYNYVSAELLVKALRYAFNKKDIYLHLQPALPLAGVDGTLRNRMKGAVTKGKVWAKTGTIAGISSLAGYCEAPNGHLVCFAIINQGVLHGRNGRHFQDRVCYALCCEPSKKHN